LFLSSFLRLIESQIFEKFILDILFSQKNHQNFLKEENDAFSLLNDSWGEGQSNQASIVVISIFTVQGLRIIS
jgi:hypothetical protein